MFGWLFNRKKDHKFEVEFYKRKLKGTAVARRGMVDIYEYEYRCIHCRKIIKVHNPARIHDKKVREGCPGRPI